MRAGTGALCKSLPDEGRIVTVDLASGRILARTRVGGMPTRLVLLGGR